MKKTMLLAALAALLCACDKDESKTSVNEVAACIGWDIRQEGVMTRAVSGTDIQSRISALLPTNAEMNNAGIKIKRKADNLELDAKLGQTQTLKLGAYSCTFSWNTAGVRKNAGMVTHVPTFTINSNFEVTAGVTTYTLPAVFNCLALGWDKTKFTLELPDANFNTFWQALDEGDLGLVFVSNLTDQPFTFTLTPVDTENYTAVTIDLSTQNAEYGKYYLLTCPSSTQTAQGSVTFEQFLAGTL